MLAQALLRLTLKYLSTGLSWWIDYWQGLVTSEGDSVTSQVLSSSWMHEEHVICCEYLTHCTKKNLF